MKRSVAIPAVAASLIFATTLGGCLTPRAKPAPSPAIQEARARVGAKTDACAATGDLASISPVDVGFGFGEPTLDETALRQLAKAADWLKCNPRIEVSILPTADGHGTPAQRQALASARAKAVVDQLRKLGAQHVVHTLAEGAADPLTAPHLVIQAQGRGW